MPGVMPQDENDDGKVNGLYVGPYAELMGTRQELVAGVTVLRVGVFELREGSHFEPADAEAQAAYDAWLLEDSPEEPNPPAEPEPEPEAADPQPAPRSRGKKSDDDTTGADD